MGCSNSKSTTTATTSDTPMMSAKTGETPQQQQQGHEQSRPEYPQSEAFSIPFDNENATDVAKRPPKRIQALLQIAEEFLQPTLAELQVKQERADLRRQELLQEKLSAIQRNTQMLMHSEHVATALANDDSVSTYRSPTKIQQ